MKEELKKGFKFTTPILKQEILIIMASILASLIFILDFISHGKSMECQLMYNIFTIFFICAKVAFLLVNTITKRNLKEGIVEIIYCFVGLSAMQVYFFTLMGVSFVASSVIIITTDLLVGMLASLIFSGMGKIIERR